MPIYEFRCAACGGSQDCFKHIAERDDAPACACGAPTTRALSAPMVSIPANLSYQCPVTGQAVSSERQRDRIMKENRLIDANDFTPSYMVDRKRRQTQANQKLAAQLYADVPREVTAAAAKVLANAP